VEIAILHVGFFGGNGDLVREKIEIGRIENMLQGEDVGSEDHLDFFYCS
jgi:hypothetical protein